MYLRDRDRAGARDPAEVVAAEVDEHDVLGPLLRVALELLGEQRVLAGVGAARPRAGDRVGREPVALDLEEQLGRCADDLERGRPDEEQVRARVDPAQRAVEADARRAVGRPGRRQLERLAPREHDLDRLAGGDRVLGDLDGPDVLVAAEARLDRPGRSSPPSGAGPAGAGRDQLGGRRAVPSARAPRRSPARRCGSGPRGRGVSVWSEAIADSVWVRWSKTRTRSVSMKAAIGTPTGSASGSGTVGSNVDDRVVGEGADGPAGEARHPLDRLDAAPGHEGAERGERIGRLGGRVTGRSGS